MSQSDSFSTFNQDDKTIIRPSPGGRRRQTPVAPPSQINFSGKSGPDALTDFLAGSNPLIANAFSLLSIVSKLRHLPFHHAVDELQEQLVDAIRSFEGRALQQGASPEQVKIAGYFLCALIDEAVLNTPWGTQSNWGHNSLLIRFHNEAWGGERFFQILDRLKQHPTQSLNLLELAYLCLSLGFEGKYRVAGGGIREIEQLRQELYLLMYRLKGDSERTLSPRWQGLRDLRHPLGRHVPVWVITVVSGALLVMIYLGFAYAVNRSSDRVYGELAALAREEVKTFAARPREPAALASDPIRADRFTSLLAAEISREMVEVLDDNALRISNSFPAGSDQINKDFIPMLTKIARELQNDTGRIVVVGHTDSRPIFSARFPSNWHLSQARAKNVAGLLIASAPLKARISFEGHADSEPIAPNDTAENRARNRRIEIQIR
jgi:type VI secretion system protein ImpK